MNKTLLIAAAVIIGIVLAFVTTRQSEATPLSVSEISSDPSAYSGQITFTGVMGAVSQEDASMVGIMDLKELQCQSPNCNKVYVPVKCNGKVPALGDEVKVTGNFVKVGTYYMFAADKIKVVRNHKIGG